MSSTRERILEEERNIEWVVIRQQKLLTKTKRNQETMHPRNEIRHTNARLATQHSIAVISPAPCFTDAHTKTAVRLLNNKSPRTMPRTRHGWRKSAPPQILNGGKPAIETDCGTCRRWHQAKQPVRPPYAKNTLPTLGTCGSAHILLLTASRRRFSSPESSWNFLRRCSMHPPAHRTAPHRTARHHSSTAVP